MFDDLWEAVQDFAEDNAQSLEGFGKDMKEAGTILGFAAGAAAAGAFVLKKISEDRKKKENEQDDKENQ